MTKYFISIVALSLCLLVTSVAEARLTLGVVIGPEAGTGALTRDQVQSLASQLMDKLDDNITIKELPDSTTLVNWLDQFAAVDMALLPSVEIATFKGRFLLIGPLDPEGAFTLVARQGVGGDLAQRAAELVRETGFSPWRPVVTEAPERVTIDAVIAAELEPSAQDQARAEPMEPVSRAADIAASPLSEPRQTGLVLAIGPELGDVLKTTTQAEALAGYLESVLPVAVQVKLFDRADNFTEWFMRYRMIDMAVVTPGFAAANLGRDYRLLAGFSGDEAPGREGQDVFIVRHDLDAAMAEDLRTALVGMMQTEAGQGVLAGLPVVRVDDLAEGFVPPAVAEAPVIPLPVAPLEAPVAAVPEEVVDLIAAPAEYPEPTEPGRPVAVALPQLPTLPVTRVPGDLPPEPASPDLVPVLPESPDAPEAPVETEMITVVAPAVPLVEQGVAVPPSPPDLSELPVPAAPDVPEFREPTETFVLSAEVPKPAAPDVPELPVASVPAPPRERVETLPAPVIPELPEAPVPVADVEIVAPPEVVMPAVPELAEEAQVEAVAVEQSIVEEIPAAIPEVVMQVPEPVPPTEVLPARVVEEESLAELRDNDIIALLGEDSVAAIVSQPDIPQELRPPGVPVVRPGRVAPRTSAVEEGLLLATPAKPIEQKEPVRPPQLLPAEEPEPGVVYIIPFVSVMVPKQVSDRIFDQFVDNLIVQGNALKLQFVILKEGLQRVDPNWLAVRKYVTGELYAYVEEKGSTATDLRSKARLIYYRPYQETPSLSFEYPVTMFFDNDQSTLEDEREKLADNIAATLTSEFLKALKN